MRHARLLIAALALLGACSEAGETRAQAELEDAQLSQPTRQLPADAEGLKTSFAPVVRMAAPAVVNISALRIVRARSDPFWEFFGGGMPRAQVANSIGSGVIVRPDGVIVTNNHVIEGAQEMKVVLHDRREFPARVLLADPRSDLAVLKIDVGAERLPVLPLQGADDTEVGDLVLAIGNPFGVGQTVTNGIVSALNRTDVGITDYSFFIQTDAAVNPGNSGGALVDMDGDLIGINTAIFSRSGSSSGVSFAIPAQMVRRVVESAAGGSRTVVRPWLGAGVQPVTSDIARSLGLPRPEGVIVTGVYDNGPAARAGVRVGDVIRSVDGGAINDEAGLTFRVGTKRPGESAQLQVIRDGRTLQMNARVEPPPATPARDARELTGRPLQGATVANLSPALADELGLDPLSAQGVVVTEVSGRGFAAAAGFQRGDVILRINNQDIESTAQLARLVATPQPAWRVTIERRGRQITAQFRGG